ncbi:MAG: hypothetical protein HKN13_13710 [Rhodothermales bacterium]|nr:hypothetical protein [Rhodothermales bacterium]
MKTEEIVSELIEAARQMGISVRNERGRFRGGICTVDEEEQILLNKRQPPEAHLAILAESLSNKNMDNVFLTPTVRKALEQSWAKREQVDVEIADS